MFIDDIKNSLCFLKYLFWIILATISSRHFTLSRFSSVLDNRVFTKLLELEGPLKDYEGQIPWYFQGRQVKFSYILLMYSSTMKDKRSLPRVIEIIWIGIKLWPCHLVSLGNPHSTRQWRGSKFGGLAGRSVLWSEA